MLITILVVKGRLEVVGKDIPWKITQMEKDGNDEKEKDGCGSINSFTPEINNNTQVKNTSTIPKIS